MKKIVNKDVIEAKNNSKNQIIAMFLLVGMFLLSLLINSFIIHQIYNENNKGILFVGSNKLSADIYSADGFYYSNIMYDEDDLIAGKEIKHLMTIMNNDNKSLFRVKPIVLVENEDGKMETKENLVDLKINSKMNEEHIHYKNISFKKGTDGYLYFTTTTSREENIFMPKTAIKMEFVFTVKEEINNYSNRAMEFRLIFESEKYTEEIFQKWKEEGNMFV